MNPRFASTDYFNLDLIQKNNTYYMIQKERSKINQYMHSFFCKVGDINLSLTKLKGTESYMLDFRKKRSNFPAFDVGFDKSTS